MRVAFVNTLTKLAREDKNIYLLIGDVGFSVFENFRDEFPERFYNMGVAEQNMIGVAAGLALSGKTVFVYSIIPFAIMRCYEQIRNDLCMQNLNVKVVGMGAGLHYGSSGPSHHAIEDISIMRALPNMTVFSPSIPEETAYLVDASVKCNGPVYIRLSSMPGDMKSARKEKYFFGKGVLINNGDDITLISTGSIGYYLKDVVDQLEKDNVSARFINIHTIKPIDKDIIKKAALETKIIFTIEEHSIIGGLGTIIAEVLSEFKHTSYVKMIGINDIFIRDVGSRENLLERYSLTTKGILDIVLKEVRECIQKKS